MKYTVVLFDPLRIEYTEQVRKAFDELRSPEPVTVTAVNDLLENGSIMYSTNPEVGERYKNLEQDFLRIKVYDIPEGTNVKSTASAYWDKSSISKRYQKPLKQWR